MVLFRETSHVIAHMHVVFGALRRELTIQSEKRSLQESLCIAP